MTRVRNLLVRGTAFALSPALSNEKEIRTKWNPALCMCVYLRQVYRNRVRVRLGTGQFIYKNLNLKMLEDAFFFFFNFLYFFYLIR